MCDYLMDEYNLVHGGTMAHDGSLITLELDKTAANMGGKTQITSRENYRLLVSIGEVSGGRRS